MQFLLDVVFAALPEESRSWLESFVARAGRRGVDLYLVGGPVRDLALGRGIRDVDLLVESSQSKKLESLLRKMQGDELKVVRHERFGTWVLSTPTFELDIATTRRESYAAAGALPDVEPAGLLEDLERRDFRVNALALPLQPLRPAGSGGDAGAPRGSKRERVKVLAPESALEDLSGKRLGVFHAQSFLDDPTRALRAARLAPRLDFQLSRASKVALRDALRDGAFGRVSGDRLRREFEKLFSDSVLGLDPAVALKRLASWHVLAALEPGLGLPREVAAPLRRLGRSLLRPSWRLARHRPWVAGLAVWLSAFPPAMRRRALVRLSVRGETKQRIVDFPKRRDGALKKLEKTRGRGGVDALLGDFDEETLLALHACANPSVRRRIVRWASEDRERRAPIAGSDLIELGLEGPAVGRALARVRAAWLDSTIKSRQEALALARELAHRAQRRKPTGAIR